MKRVLIITYYWPPSGGAGVQRWLKFVKHLRENNWEPVVYTPINPEIPYRDESLLHDIPTDIEVIGTKIFEPYAWYNMLTGKKKNAPFQHGFLKDQQDKKPRFSEQLAIWIRGNFFIPDARAFWVRPSVRFLCDYVKKHPVDLIVSSGPPHSLHLIAKGLKKHSNLPWVADFRDPWTGIYYFDKLKLTALAKKIHHRLEQQCLDTADHIITVGQTMKNDFARRTTAPITVVTNGFDEEDFAEKGHSPSEKFSIFYSGMFLPDQNPTELWKVLQEIVNESTAFEQQLELRFIGRCDAKILQDISDHDLNKHLVLEDYVPHAALPALQQAASLLLLSINRIENASYILTGKVFEYLAAARPVLAFCPDNSDVANIINETRSGYTIAFGQRTRLKALLLELFKQHQSNQLTLSGQDVSAYSRKALTKHMADIFNLHT